MSDLVSDRLYGASVIVPPLPPVGDTTAGDTEGTRRCRGCDKIMQPDEIGGFGSGDSDNRGEIWFHNAPQCMIDAAELMVADHKHSLRTIARGMQGKPTKEDTHGQEKPRKNRGGFNSLGF